MKTVKEVLYCSFYVVADLCILIKKLYCLFLISPIGHEHANLVTMLYGKT